MKTKSNIPIVGLKELRENMSQYVSAVEKGKSFLVLRKSKPIFAITPVDEWGDEGHWKTVIDFTKIRKRGIPAEEVLKSLKKLQNEQAK